MEAGNRPATHTTHDPAGSRQYRFYLIRNQYSIERYNPNGVMTDEYQVSTGQSIERVNTTTPNGVAFIVETAGTYELVRLQNF